MSKGGLDMMPEESLCPHWILNTKSLLRKVSKPYSNDMYTD